MAQGPTEDAGRLLLRLTVGGLMLPHGLSKLAHGVAGVRAAVVGHGLPPAFAYGVYVGEVLAPLLLILGVATRPAAAVLAFNMVVAVWLAHAAEIARLSPHGGVQLELQYFYFFGACAIALLGPGRFALGQRLRR